MVLACIAGFQYSLDHSTWSGCGATLRVGPLSAGAHELSVRTTLPGSNGSESLFGPRITHRWTIVTLSNSTVTLSGLTDGRHSLQVIASDDVGHVEAAPRTYSWTVDTVPPTTIASRLSPALTNETSGVVTASCSNEAYPLLCSFCWVLSVVGVGQLSEACVGNGSEIVVAVPIDGQIALQISAVDGAGNHGAPIVLNWVQDTTPPHTLAVITSTTMFVEVRSRQLLLPTLSDAAMRKDSTASVPLLRVAGPTSFCGKYLFHHTRCDCQRARPGVCHHNVPTRAR